MRRVRDLRATQGAEVAALARPTAAPGTDFVTDKFRAVSRDADTAIRDFNALLSMERNRPRINRNLTTGRR